MKTWDAFFRDVLPSVPQCPEPTVEHALLRAAQTFCVKAGVWRVWLDPITTIADTTEYDLNLEPRTELVKLERATLDKRPLRITTTESLPTDWQDNTAGIEDCVFTPDRKTLVLLPAKAADLILRVEATLKPSNSAEGVEDFIFDEYTAQIAMGAKADLMMQPGQPYTNMALGQTLADAFTRACASTAFQKFRGFSSAMPRARLQTF